MQIRVHSPTDPDAADVGAKAFTSVVTAYREAGMFVPETFQTDLFSQLWATRMLVVIGAWENAVMTGCRVLLLAPSFFQPDKRVASQLSVFVTPDMRGRGIGEQLMVQGDNLLKSHGVMLSTMVAPDEALGRKLGYSPVALYMEKVL